MAAIDNYNDTIDQVLENLAARSISLTQAKDLLRKTGKRFYREVTKEEYAHLRQHVQAEIDSEDTSEEEKARLIKVRNNIDSARNDDGHLPTDLVGSPRGR